MKRSPLNQKSYFYAEKILISNFANSQTRFRAINVQGAVSSDLTYEIVLRRENQIVPGWRVLHEGKTFNVLHSYDGYDNATVLQVREIQKRS